MFDHSYSKTEAYFNFVVALGLHITVRRVRLGESSSTALGLRPISHTILWITQLLMVQSYADFKSSLLGTLEHYMLYLLWTAGHATNLANPLTSQSALTIIEMSQYYKTVSLYSSTAE